jgi:ribosomal protein S18 acetylase RimI-like enzyme
MIEIRQVQSKRELAAFIQFPYQHYKNDPLWVAPLRSEQRAQFDPRHNLMLTHCEVALFLACQGNTVLGRVAAFIDQLAVDFWGQPVGLFGSYECVDDPAVSHLLLETTTGWLSQRGMQFMRGPWSFASQEWGLVIEGFSPRPVIMAPHNPPYYQQQLTSFGLAKIEDLLVYYADAREGYQIPERYLTLTDKIQKRYNVRVRPVNMKELEKDVVIITDISNRSISANWGYYPVPEEEGRALARDLKAVINPRAALIAETEDGTPVGFAISIPDVNVLLRGLNGRLLPFGWLKLLTGLPRLTQYRMWALGVVPEYQGKAIDTLLYRATYDAIFSDQLRLEINYVLESNDRMRNALEKLNVKPLRRYRVFEMPLTQSPH